MKSLIQKKHKKNDRVAQCCAKVSAIKAGCHD